MLQTASSEVLRNTIKSSWASSDALGRVLHFISFVEVDSTRQSVVPIFTGLSVKSTEENTPPVIVIKVPPYLEPYLGEKFVTSPIALS